jgi:hypothetical protein
VVYNTNRKVYVIVGESRLVGATTMGVTLKTINDLSTFVVTYTNVTGVGLERGSIVET